MKILTNILLGILIVLVAYSIFFKAVPALGASTAGTTFSTEKIGAVAINLANPGANGTSTSVLNSDANDRFVTAVKLGCENVGTSNTAYTGTGLISLQLTIGTTTTSAPATIPTNKNLLANAFVVSTSTVNLTVASSSAAFGNQLSTLWPAGSYMTFWLNATNTATCTIGVSYLGS